MLKALLDFVRENGRVCPIPQRWNELWAMLPSRRRVENAWKPPMPLVLAVWWDTPALMKMARLEEHIRYAEAHGVLVDIDRYLRGLPEKEWAHLFDFRRSSIDADGSQSPDASNSASEREECLGLLWSLLRRAPVSFEASPKRSSRQARRRTRKTRGLPRQR